MVVGFKVNVKRKSSRNVYDRNLVMIQPRTPLVKPREKTLKHAHGDAPPDAARFGATSGR